VSVTTFTTFTTYSPTCLIAERRVKKGPGAGKKQDSEKVVKPVKPVKAPGGDTTQLDGLVLSWSGGGRAHRAGCRHLGSPAVSGDIMAAALALRRPCGTYFGRGGMTWEGLHREATRVRMLATEAGGQGGEQDGELPW